MSALISFIVLFLAPVSHDFSLRNCLTCDYMQSQMPMFPAFCSSRFQCLDRESARLVWRWFFEQVWRSLDRVSVNNFDRSEDAIRCIQGDTVEAWWCADRDHLSRCRLGAQGRGKSKFQDLGPNVLSYSSIVHCNVIAKELIAPMYWVETVKSHRLNTKPSLADAPLIHQPAESQRNDTLLKNRYLEETNMKDL